MTKNGNKDKRERKGGSWVQHKEKESGEKNFANPVAWIFKGG